MNRQIAAYQAILRRLAVSGLLLSVTATSLAADGYLPSGKPNTVALLAPPPETDSPEQAADMATVQAAFKNHTKADEALGKAQKEITFASFTPVVSELL